MKLRQRWIAIGTAGLAAALVVSIALAYAVGWLRPPTPRATTPMSQSIYVWQRAWGDPVRRAVVDHASAADGGLIALASMLVGSSFFLWRVVPHLISTRTASVTTPQPQPKGEQG